MNAYSYIIIKENSPKLERERALLENNYNGKKRYAMITKVVHPDNSENIATIEYSNDMQALQARAKLYDSWYNYPLNLCKDLQGYIRELP